MKFKIVIDGGITVEKEIDGEFSDFLVDTDESHYKLKAPKLTLSKNDDKQETFTSKDLDDLFADDSFWDDNNKKTKKSL